MDSTRIVLPDYVCSPSGLYITPSLAHTENCKGDCEVLATHQMAIHVDHDGRYDHAQQNRLFCVRRSMKCQQRHDGGAKGSPFVHEAEKARASGSMSNGRAYQKPVLGKSRWPRIAPSTYRIVYFGYHSSSFLPHLTSLPHLTHPHSIRRHGKAKGHTRRLGHTCSQAPHQ
jgi:hypothetical protein